MSESYAVSEKRELLLERVRKFILDNGGIVKRASLPGWGSIIAESLILWKRGYSARKKRLLCSSSQ